MNAEFNELYERFAALVNDGVILRNIATMDHTQGQLSSFQTQASIMELQRLMGGPNVLEIGTYFGNTTYRVAETAARVGGGIVSIDPYGGERMPGIIASWPAQWQEKTEFHAMNSMSYFLMLKDRNTPKAADAPFDIAYIDGDHGFDYVIYDLLQSASYLKPGGVIFAGAIEQTGPHDAVKFFLDQYRLWKPLEMGKRPMEGVHGGNSAILFAPPGIELGGQTYKMLLRELETLAVEELRLPLVPTQGEGVLHSALNLSYVAYDNHIRGDGLVAKLVRQETPVKAGADGIDIKPTKVLSVTPPPNRPGHITLEVELTFIPSPGREREASSLLLDVKRDLELY